MKKSDNGRLIVAIGVLLLIGIQTGWFEGVGELASGFTPIFCNEFEFMCCTVHDSPDVDGCTHCYWFRCPDNVAYCEIHSLTNEMVGEFERYGYCDPVAETKGNFAGETEDANDYLGLKLNPGECIYYNTLFAYLLDDMSIVTHNYYYKMFNCKDSPCGSPSSGLPLSSTCNWKGDITRAYDEYGNLKDPNYQGIYNVPPGYCYLITSYANRRICGYAEESCSSHTDCANLYPWSYTYQGDKYGATCS